MHPFVWLAGTFGIWRTVAGIVAVVALLSSSVGFYAKGRMDANLKHELAAARALLEAKTEELADLHEAMEFGETLADAMDKAEKKNDAVSDSIVRIEPGTKCLSPGFVRRLDELH